MVKISSSWTFFLKRVFPVIWFGFLAVFAVGMLTAMLAKNQLEPIALVAPVIMAVIGFLVMKLLVFDLVDEVWDDGDALIVRNRGIEETVLLKDIINLSYSGYTNPPRATLLLREPSAFGTEITFAAPSSFIPFSRPPMIWDLIHRIDEERGKS